MAQTQGAAPSRSGGGTIPQTQSKEALLKSYTKRLKDDTKSMVDNYTEILRLCKFEDDGNVLAQVSRQTQCELDGYEMQVRAANIVRAGESLMNLVSDIKQFLILNDFPSTNDSIMTNNKKFRNTANEMDKTLLHIRDEMCTDLFELEEEYYLSMYK